MRQSFKIFLLLFIIFSATHCYGQKIHARQPVVLYGPDTACTKSVLDVPFYSSGNYNNGNTYLAQLSDANGSFAKPTIIGSLRDSSTYDSSLVTSPGIVSGLIPNVPPGCSYYIRVVSTNPVVDSAHANSYGPFCLKQCDILTDSAKDVHACITADTGENIAITLTINQWNNKAQYAPGDSFLIQVINSKSYSIINTGSLGVAATNKSGTVTLKVPKLSQAISLLDTPGTGVYYIRLVVLHSSTPWNNYGTLVRLVIGSVNPTASMSISDTLICSNGGGAIRLQATSVNLNSNYQWQVDPRLGYPPGSAGSPFYTSYPPPYEFGISIPPNFSPGYYWFSVREVNNGCFSPWADSTHLRVIPTPSVTITGADTVCFGDTTTFSALFTSDTYYQWSATGGSVVGTSDNAFKLVFDSAEAVTLHVLAINQCGQSTDSKKIIVVSKCPPPSCSAHFIIYPDSFNLHHWYVLNLSKGIMPITYTWIWGDGDTSTGSNPSHAYATEGYYNICVLLTDNAGCNSTFCDSTFYLSRMDGTDAMVYINVVNSRVTGVPPVIKDKSITAIYPNPCNTCFVTGIDNVADLQVTDLLGQTVHAMYAKLPSGYEINIPNRTGMFLVRNLKTGETIKLVKE